jgi:hypothetical protein
MPEGRKRLFYNGFGFNPYPRHLSGWFLLRLIDFWLSIAV